MAILVRPKTLFDLGDGYQIKDSRSYVMISPLHIGILVAHIGILVADTVGTHRMIDQ